MTRPQRQIAVVGGGWGGLACAERLAAEPSGCRVVLFEAAPQLGGRARGLLWEEQIPIDAGQHLMIAAYTQTLALLKRAGALSSAHWQMDWLRWSSHCGGQTETLTGLLPELLWAWPWLMRPAQPGQTVYEWLRHSGCSDRLLHLLLRPLAEGALNTDWMEASGSCFQTVLRDASLRGPWSLRTLHPRRNLSLDGIDPIAQLLQRQGVQIRLRSRVTGVASRPNGQWTLRGQEEPWPEAFDEVVFALPSGALHRTLGRPEPRHPPEVRAIGSLFLLVGPQQSAMPSGRMHCFYDAHSAQGPVMGVARPSGPWGQVLCMVVSALPDQRDLHDAALARAQRAAAQWLGATQPLRSQWIVDRQATWAATPAACAQQPTRVAYQALGAGLWHCSDQLVSGYPATIESAVRSGRAVAAALLS